MLEKISALLDNYEAKIYDDFKTIVNINSFSYNMKGIERMSAVLQEIAEHIGVQLEILFSTQKRRPHLGYNLEREKDYYAMVGHFDTVHPPESDFSAIREEGVRLYGPGTNDMKSGLIVAIYSLALLQRLFPGRTLPLKALFNADEEIGSPDSEEIIRDIFAKARGGFVFEPGRLEENAVVTERKGIFGLEIEIAGKSAHSGVEPWKGVNAIVEAARIITALERLNAYEEGISVGCNTIEGGIATNVVAPRCMLAVDIRYARPDQERVLLAAIESILEAPTVTGAVVTHTFKHGRPPMEKTEASEALYGVYRRVSERLGIVCGQKATGGVSDANFLSAMGIPVIDGVGAVGDGSHTREEYTLKHSIVDRIKIFTLLMAEKIEAES